MKNKNIVRVAIISGAILLIPLFGNIFVTGWNWGLFDFILAFVMLFSTGIAIDFVIRRLPNLVLKVVAVIGILLAFVMLWTEMAVGAVSRLVGMLF